MCLKQIAACVRRSGVVLGLAVGLSFCGAAVGQETGLWYDRPATNWNEALPLGNGRLGAMVFGGVGTERFQLNEESLWAGCPVEAWPEDFFTHVEEVRRLLFAGKNLEAHEYGLRHLTAKPTAFRSYEPLADLWLDFEGPSEISRYRRELELSDGVARVSFEVGKSQVTREVFISAADDVLVARLAASGGGPLAFKVRLTRAKDATVYAVGTNRLHLDGQIMDVAAEDGGYDDNPGGSGPGGAHMKFAGRLLVRVDEGRVTARGDQLAVAGAREAVILFSVATDYNLARLNFDRRLNPGRQAEKTLRQAGSKSWATLLAAHRQEHRAVFDRVSVTLSPPGRSEAALPTDARLAALREGADDPGLVALHFQFGRYLLMSSSRRPGRLPANLQGLWSDHPWAPWEADYHLNINLQMNYWPARAANLPETATPLLDWLERLARRGHESARRLYGADGWAAFLATNPFGRVTPSGSTLDSQFLNGSLDPLCGAWLAAELFDHYQFGGDRAFLRRLWPVLEGACEFVLDTLVACPDGTLVVSPSTSPENSYVDPATGKKLRITLGSTYHQSLVRAVLDATERAGTLLGRGGNLRRRIAAARAKLPPIRVGPDGRVLEWREPYREVEPGHRHVSHLIGLYPFDLISGRTPELLAGARKTLDFRLQHGGGGFGWSRAWMINFFARLRDGDAAGEQYRQLLQRSTQPNLLNNVPLFQIDGNLGAAAGLCEMLVQSHERVAGAGPAEQKFVLDLLPALPVAWSAGSARGLCARGGFTVDLAWREGQLTRAAVHAVRGGDCEVRWRGRNVAARLNRGGTLRLEY